MSIPPINKFKQWTAENRSWFKEKFNSDIIVRKFPDPSERKQFMDQEWEEACLWLMVNESNRKANKTDWGKFLMNWYRESIRRRFYRDSHMTRQQDNDYHNDRKQSRLRRGTSEMEGIDDLDSNS